VKAGGLAAGLSMVIFEWLKGNEMEQVKRSAESIVALREDESKGEKSYGWMRVETEL